MNYKKITTFEDACKVRGYSPDALPDVSKLAPKFQKWLTANYKLAVITEAINTDENGKVWEPNWHDTNQSKYFPWFEIKASEDKPAGFAFSHSACDSWRAHTNVGSRLCFDTREKVAHIQKHFEQLHLEQQLILE